MKRKLNFVFKIKYALIALTIIMLGAIVLSYAYGEGLSSIRNTVVSIFSPARNLVISIRDSIDEDKQSKSTKEELMSRIEALESENEALNQKLGDYNSDMFELNELRDLLALSEKYSDFQTLGATIIAKDTSNWFSEFTIDKGSEDGIEVDMNVLWGNGLAGLVTEVGEGYSIVTSIIQDDMNVSAVSSSTRDTCIVSGDLELMEKGYVSLMYIQNDAKIGEYERIITSTTSSKYLPGILIGYAYDIKNDTNGLTKSGYLIPVVDFKHMEHVLVVLTTKEQMY
ncbi:MAG: rod shape-determining protein MreC [Lachnospiraceae bacterium]|nr:rod shape-determining protein MreC [Lachnospiraceae bacterium]